MKFKVNPGDELVTAGNDGGFAVGYHNGLTWAFNSKWPHAISTKVNPGVFIADESRSGKGRNMREMRRKASLESEKFLLKYLLNSSDRHYLAIGQEKLAK